MRQQFLLSCSMLLSLSFCASAFGQNSQSYLNDAGSPSYGVNIPVENGFINVSNGNLHMEFPLASHPQRGALALGEKLVYDSRIWMFSPFGSHGSYHWWPYNICGTNTTCSSAGSNSGGWQFRTGLEIGSMAYNETSQNLQTANCINYGGDFDDYEDVGTITYQMIWTDPSLTGHPFANALVETINNCTGEDNQALQPGTASDGSGYNLQDDGSGNPILTDNSGTEVYPQIIDRYGNYWSNDGNGNLVDDTGRIPVIVTQNGSTTYYDVLAPNGPINNNGTRVRYTVTTALVPVATNFGQSDTYEFLSPQYSWQTPLLNPIHTIQLPDGSSYTFNYDSYGGMSSVTLPTGGTITYGYTNFEDSSQTYNRWLSSRTVGSNAAMTISPSVVTQCANYSTGCVEQDLVHQPSGDETVYRLTLNNGAWNTGTSIYSGSAASGQLLAQVINYDSYTNGCANANSCLGGNYLSQDLATTVVYGNSALAQSSSLYTQTLSTFNSSNGKPTSTKLWDYNPYNSGISTTAPRTAIPDREVDYSYTGNDVYQVEVLAGNAQAGLTTYSYTTSATATSGLPNHGAQNAGGPYLLSVAHWLNTDPSNSPTTSYSMDDSGMVTAVTDADNHPASQMSYQCANSLPYQATNALQQITQSAYDCSSGALMGMQDPNDLAASRSGTTYSYEAAAARVQTVTSADGGTTTYSYPATAEVDVSVVATPDPTITSSTVADTYGRPYKSIAGGSETDTTYDANGRANCVTLPYAAGGSPSGSTCVTSYDGLGRPLVQTQPDGQSSKSWLYGGQWTQATDERGNSWTRVSNAFGYLTNVYEPGIVGGTAYEYDGLGNLMYIWQQGNTGETNRGVRSFMYDSLSRLVCETQPENTTSTCSGTLGSTPAGAVSYIYDANGNVAQRTDARGQTVSYSYDNLNRILTSSQNGVAINQYVYDGDVGLSGSTPNLIGRLSFTRALNPDVVSNCNFTTRKCDDEYFGYDPLGRLKALVAAPPSEWGSTADFMSATYNLAGGLSTLTYPDGLQIGHSYDSAGRLATVGRGSATQAYLSGAQYHPDGSPYVVTLGNGVSQTITENNRLQPLSIQISAPSGALASQTLLSHTYCYSTTDCSVAGSASNNGNIWQIADTLNASRTQAFNYDSLNRLTSFSLNGVMKQQFSIDSFGNMANTMASFVPSYANATNNHITNLPCASSFSGGAYDAAGNQTCDTDPGTNGVVSYKFDAASRLSSITPLGNGSPSDFYSYDASGSRIRKDNATGLYTEYAYFNGQVIGEKTGIGNGPATWTDYIYANGQKIAKTAPVDHRLHVHGVTVQGGYELGVDVPPPLNFVVRPGDQTCWRQFDGNVVGGINLQFTQGLQTAWHTLASDGEGINQDFNQGGWYSRCASLNDFVGQTLVGANILKDVDTGPGTWDLLIADWVYLRADGTVIQQFVPGQTPSLTVQGINSQYDTSFTAVIEDVPTGQDPFFSVAASSAAVTHFYMGDHLGTAQMEFASGGWPVWQGQFAPYGQELDNQTTANNYKFIGLERDQESGLDHTPFRQYASAVGRWSTPDPYNGSIDPGNPQTFNRYAYANNWPLIYADPNGLDPLSEIYTISLYAFGAGGEFDPLQDVVGGLLLGFDALADALFGGLFAHPQLTASHTPRPKTQNNTGKAKTCETNVLNATNNKFGTNFSSNDVTGEFQYSTGAPAGQGTLNLDISSSQAAAVSAGRFPLHWWSYIIGYGSTLHVPTGPGGMDSLLTLKQTASQFTAHLDSAYPYGIGFVFHYFLDIKGLGGYKPCP